MPGIEESKCILVTVATAGIGRALALSLAKLPSMLKVIAAGHRLDRLEELRKADLETVRLELDTDATSLKKSVDDILQRYPQYEFDLKKEIDIAKLQTELTINYTSVVTTIAYLLPHFLKLSGHPSFIIPVTGGLGIVPAVWCPGYSASKAALHSFTTSLRVQVRDTNIIFWNSSRRWSSQNSMTGTTEKLEKIPMPLVKYTEVTMEDLRKGTSIISTGGPLTWCERFDKEKEVLAEQLLDLRRKW